MEEKKVERPTSDHHWLSPSRTTQPEEVLGQKKWFVFIDDDEEKELRRQKDPWLLDSSDAGAFYFPPLLSSYSNRSTTRSFFPPSQPPTPFWPMIPSTGPWRTIIGLKGDLSPALRRLGRNPCLLKS
ncbi:uncharacterized protein LOC129315055 [Prosopis cineraria]|uniref:uncharacterized protein LOC129315055 n=1 Tax=Prosopis cineraria TaxID=364024 RepID=UPI00240F0E31|nr:uncharacterized protein LOC129315055 [Prosopis cineraria]